MPISRLSELNITKTDPLKLAPFFAEIRSPEADWKSTTVLPNEPLRLDLLAARVYTDKNLIYVFQAIFGLDNRMDKIRSGTEFQYPSESWLRERIKYWQKFYNNAA